MKIARKLYATSIIAAFLSGSVRGDTEPGGADKRKYHHIQTDRYGAYLPLDSANRFEGYHSPIESRIFPKKAGLEALTAEQAQDNATLYARFDQLLVDMEREMADYVTPDRKLKILLFVHGGLNDRADTEARLDQKLPAIKQDGYYPIFLSWRSGPWVSIFDRYYRVRNGGLAEGPLAKVRAVPYFATDLLTGVAQLPETVWDQTANVFSSNRARRVDPLNRDKSDIRFKCAFPEDGATQAEKRNATASWGEENKDFDTLTKAGYWTKQVVPGATRLVTTPLVQGLASPAWQMMLRRAKNLTAMEADALRLEDHYGDAGTGEVLGNGAASILARRLKRLETRLATEGVTLEIHLYGHSMGAIVANDLVSDFPELPYTRIVHLASADSVRNWLDKTAPYLEKHDNAEFYNLALHPTHEEREDVSVVSVLPEGSLLVWLDDMLTKPDHVLDRRSGRWSNAKYLLPVYTELGNAKLKVFDLNGRGPMQHGAFGRHAFWRPEFYWFGDEAETSDATISSASSSVADGPALGETPVRVAGRRGPKKAAAFHHGRRVMVAFTDPKLFQ